MKVVNKLLLLLFLGLPFVAQTQMAIGRDSLFGNEWIDYSKTYFRMPIAADGVYRLPTAALTAAGVPTSVAGDRFQIFVMGREIPIYTTTNSAFGASDYIEFYGRKVRNDLDSMMFVKGSAGMLNPESSLYNDTMSYFLTWNSTGVNKRITTQINDLTNLPAKESWFWHTEKYIGTEQSTKPELGSGIYLPEFSEGEGFGSFYTNSRSIPFSTKYRIEGQPAQARIRWTGELYSHYTTISINDDIRGRDTTYNFGVRTRTIDIPADKVGATVSVILKGSSDAQDYNSVGTASLRYARAFDFDNTRSFEFPVAASTTVKYLEIENFNAGTAAPILYDLTNNWRIPTTLEGIKIRVALPPSVVDRNLILVATTALTTPTVKPQPFTDLRTDGGDYLLISSSRHINDANNNLKQYADYRASANGGSYKTKIIDVDQLYQQFAYGITRHPLSIRNFTQFIKKNWANPRYIVLVGKGREYRVGNGKVNLEAPENRTFDVPTWGYPGSDVLLVNGRKSDEPLIPFGRIAVTTSAEIKTYLDKVKEFEGLQQTAPQSLDKREWFKNIMHLSGGGQYEIASIASNMEGFKNIIENGKFGGKVTTFGKSNLDPVQTAQNDLIFENLNKGMSMIGFYGHSSASILDFDINNPSQMKNKGKYPIFLALGCSAANIHQNFAGISENFVFYQDKGMSAFMGTTGTSFLHSLNIFASDLYKNLGDNLYGETIGNIIKKTMSVHSPTTDQGVQSVLQEFVLNGDPALRYSVGVAADYLPDEKTVKFAPSVLNAQLDSFNVSFDIVNLGAANTDSMNVVVRQQLPNNTLYDLKTVRVKTPQYRTTLNLRLAMPVKVVLTGQNRLQIRIDADNEIAEFPSASAEGNNDIRSSTGELGIPFYILGNNAKPVYPTEFAIVGKAPIVLKASTSDALAKAQNYIMEMDTTERFNSAFKQRTVINQKGGVLKWTPNVAWRDSGVYYWRISIDSTSPQTGYSWESRSFTFIKEQEGWGQSHYFQFLKNDYKSLVLNNDDRKFAFATDIKSVEVRYPYSSISPSFIPLFLVNNQFYTGRNWGFPSAGIYVTVFDEPTGEALRRKNVYSEFGLPHPQGWDINSYVFSTDAATPQTGRKGLMDFLNAIPKKSIVQIFTVQQTEADTYYPERWAADSVTLGTNIFKMLEAEGATRVRELATAGSKPYAFAYQKGKGAIAENRGQKHLDGAPILYQMANRWFKGDMTSKVIGPVAEWKTLEINYNENRSAGSGDTVNFDIIGMTAAEKGVETVLMQNVRANTPLSTINVRQYPFLKLRFNTRDSFQRTSPQLLSWRVLYRGLPDLAVNPNVAFSFSKDTVAQGEKVSINVGVENVSEIDADSVTIQWTVRDQANNETSTNRKFAPLSKNANFSVPISLDSKTWRGQYNFEFTVNPRGIQPELYSFNNYLQKPFVVFKDRKRPLLDVLVDGIKIAQNDIVPARPTITVSLLDDNTFLKLTDTSVLTLTLQYPKGAKKTIAFNDPNVKFTPATGASQNKATLEFKPIFTEDGIYTLTVKGKDMSDNSAGDVDYSLNFKVITKSSISNVLNYPNPFSTRTQFVYTMTGDVPPQYFRIQIMTISGKVVREITQDEIGTLRIGTHKTDYAWDGRDEYGNQLANGVYLYRVIAKGKDGKAFEGYEDDKTNDLFKKGIGKLVILR
ncbi:MAG: C25 family cysteine peptidase [Saprospiraceae bacterium]|nr:C25 family cysteine peptidase [Saprospiraceae bacterium]